MIFERKTLNKMTSVVMSIIVLATAFFSFAPLYQCSMKGTIRLSNLIEKPSQSVAKCCCCEEKVVVETSTCDYSFESTSCCHEVSLDHSDLVASYHNLSLQAFALVPATEVKLTYTDSPQVILPRRSSKILAGVSPPIYLLKQSFLI